MQNATFQTIISGVSVFVIGQFFNEYCLKPLEKYRKLRAQAAYNMIYYRNRYNSSNKISENTSLRLREMAAELEGFSIEKPFMLFWIKRSNLKKASSAFIGLSNSVTDNPDFKNIGENEETIRNVLNLG